MSYIHYIFDINHMGHSKIGKNASQSNIKTFLRLTYSKPFSFPYPLIVNLSLIVNLLALGEHLYLFQQNLPVQ